MPPLQTETMTLPTINSTPPSSGMPSVVPSTAPSGTATPNPLLGLQHDQLPTHVRSLSPIRSREDPRAGQEGMDGGKGEKWWKIHFGRGIINDIKRRAPYYYRDWLDAWDYRVVPATVYMYFAK